ncbi:hypothetical protein L1987_44703 [Smallanthus sonchifolius]|uniref:Uncharacterized protein n=1 Tax=Smallanthus sonchifolius TaxID=185202 RepID=A0ACB9GR92_9ASTR|nr:hypothetical protein L1987_44703 [Smallanthus sonchifolius]
MTTEEPVVVAEVASPAIKAAATMIKDAILSLKDKTGSSQYAIAKFVEEKQKNLPKKFKKVLLVQLKRLVAQGKLVKPKPGAKAIAAVAPKRKPETPTRLTKVARTSTRSTPGKKPDTAQKSFRVTRKKPDTAQKSFRVTKRSTLRKVSSVITKSVAKKVALKSVKTKAATSKKSAATRKTKK